MTTIGHVPSTSKSLLHCVSCDLTLPLRAPLVNEAGEIWTCAECGAPFASVFEDTAPVEYHPRVRRVVKSTPGAAKKPPAVDAATALRQRVAEYAPRGSAMTALPRRPVAGWPLQTSLSWQIDISIARGEVLRVPPQNSPFAARIAERGSESFDQQLAGEMVQHLDASAQQLHDVFHALDQSQRADVAALPALAERSLQHATEDLDLFLSLGMSAPNSEYPQRQSLHTCMLAMGMAARLGFDQKTIVELALGCLLHDAGMLRTRDEVYSGDHVLSSAEFEDVASHPIYTFDMLGGYLENVPAASRLIAYQIHERCDGSGYPRRRQMTTIHPLARIAAVADVFVALISPRAYRPALMPYYAMEHLLRGASQGIFDLEAVRGLLAAVSLFPLGSHVMLSDGRVGKVLRSNRSAYNRPILHVPNLPGQGEDAEIVDLNEPDCELHVVRASHACRGVMAANRSALQLGPERT